MVNERKTLKVLVRLFAAYRETVGTSSLAMEVADGARVGDLVQIVCQGHPRLREMASSLLVAVNTEYVPLDTLLRDGDEVALIPPVSGG